VAEMRTPNVRLIFDFTKSRASAWLTKGTRLAPVFVPDRCQETANLLEELAEKLDALIVWI
jgi:hypothetical protein